MAELNKDIVWLCVKAPFPQPFVEKRLGTSATDCEI
jgi:hypothetical protein